MNSYIAPIISSFRVITFRNRRLLRAIYALNLDILNDTLFHSDMIKGS